MYVPGTPQPFVASPDPSSPIPIIKPSKSVFKFEIETILTPREYVVCYSLGGVGNLYLKHEASGNDYNTMIEPGMYDCWNTLMIANKPSDIDYNNAGSLVVVLRAGTFLVQWLMPSGVTGTKIYSRVSVSNGVNWLAWKALS